MTPTSHIEDDPGEAHGEDFISLEKGSVLLVWALVALEEGTWVLLRESRGNI